MPIEPILLNEKQVAARLNVSVGLIRKMRANNQGPEAIRVGGRLVRYPVEALQLFIAEQLSPQLAS